MELLTLTCECEAVVAMEKNFNIQFTIAILSKVNTVIKGNVTHFECFLWFVATKLPPALLSGLSAGQLVSAGALQSGSEQADRRKSHQAKLSYNVMSHHCWCGCWSEDKAERDMLTFRLFSSAALKLRIRPHRNSVSTSGFFLHQQAWNVPLTIRLQCRAFCFLARGWTPDM